MSGLTDKCPVPEAILKYFHMELENNELREIEAHFSKCSKCISKYDYYGSFIEQAVLSARAQKELWLNASTDTISVVAAGSFDDTGISEVVSKDGKYILKKIPYLEDERISLLVITLTDTAARGSLHVHLLEDSAPVLIGSGLIDEDNKVCFEVSSDIRLKDLIITVV